VKIITLLTDFGTKDPYVGIMKGVIISIHPHVQIVDITHEVESQDIREAAFLVESYYQYFPGGTIHLCIVDPTVGSERHPIIVSAHNQFFIGPDNGICTLLFHDNYMVYTIENRDVMSETISATFHGRDIFAPAAAYLARGTPLTSFGSPVSNPVLLDTIHPKIDHNILYGEVVRFDRFGNALTNISYELFKRFTEGKPFTIRIGKMRFTSLRKSYFEDTEVCLVGSSGYLEFATYRGNFREEHSIWKGDSVTVTI